ncbi:MAG TPA: Fe(3+) ABC transporter substrate-binding protein [Wenzhouxiangellaceae bacterium]|nr:Fe(3+) ABC transporter substrate-binding protein [Wenzhouxiangellaceae bacterium]
MFKSINRITGFCWLAVVLLFSTVAIADTVNVYSARHYDSDQKLYDAFTAETGIQVSVLEGGSDMLVERIQREGIASPADVLITVDAGRLWRAVQAGALQEVESDVLSERIPAHLRHPDGYWYGYSQRMRLIYYNPERIDPELVSTYEDLARPELEGKICIRSSNNIYNQSLLASMVEIHGMEGAEQWAEGLVDNLARQPQGGDTDQLRGVAAGECDVAVANHYYYMRLANSDDPADREVAEKVAVMLPNQDGRGVHVNIGGAGVVKHAPHRDNAIRFLEFLASDEAQEIFARANYEYPVSEGVERHEDLAEWGDVKLDELNMDALGSNNPYAVRIADRVGWR